MFGCQLDTLAIGRTCLVTSSVFFKTIHERKSECFEIPNYKRHQGQMQLSSRFGLGHTFAGFKSMVSYGSVYRFIPIQWPWPSDWSCPRFVTWDAPRRTSRRTLFVRWDTWSPFRKAAMKWGVSLRPLNGGLMVGWWWENGGLMVGKWRVKDVKVIGALW